MGRDDRFAVIEAVGHDALTILIAQHDPENPTLGAFWLSVDRPNRSDDVGNDFDVSRHFAPSSEAMGERRIASAHDGPEAA